MLFNDYIGVTNYSVHFNECNDVRYNKIILQIIKVLVLSVDSVMWPTSDFRIDN